MALTQRIDHGAIAAAEHGLSRSPHWPMAEHHWIKANPEDAAGNGDKGIQCHHEAPFHLCILSGRPDLELDPRNFISLAESEKGLTEVNAHLLIGHADDFQSSNLYVREDVIRWKGKSEAEIKADPIFAQRVKDRCKPWAQWTEQEKKDFRAWLDATYPLPQGMTPQMALDRIIMDLKSRGIS